MKIPGNLLENSGKCCFFNNPSNVEADSRKCFRRFGGMFKKILRNVLKDSGGMLKKIPGSVQGDSRQCFKKFR